MSMANVGPEVLEGRTDSELPVQVVIETSEAEVAQDALFTRLKERRNPLSNRQSLEATALYLNDIGLYPLLTAPEEIELAQRVERGRDAQKDLDLLRQGPLHDAAQEVLLLSAVRRGARAKETFINCNLRLVVSIARRYQLPENMELLDLIQEGNLGLEHAVDKFEWRKGFKFSTYATFWIKQAVGRALDTKATLIRLPGDNSLQLRNALRTVNGDPDRLNERMSHLHTLANPASLDKQVGEEGDSTLGDLLESDWMSPENEVIDKFETGRVASLLDVLTPNERELINMRFGMSGGQCWTYRELAAEFGVTSEAIRRRLGKAIDKLRDASTQADDID